MPQTSVKKYINEQLIEQLTCANCYENRPWMMEFAHFHRYNKIIKFGKKVDIQKLKLNEVKKEIPKGRFLCIFCHRNESKNEWNAMKIRTYVRWKENTINKRVNILIQKHPDKFKICNGHFCKGNHRKCTDFSKFLNRRSTYCKECDSYRSRCLRENKQTYINTTKITIGTCTDCGFNCNESNFYLFDFDHIDPSEKFKSVSQLSSYTRKKIDAEIKICQLRCAKCHISRHKFHA